MIFIVLGVYGQVKQEFIDEWYKRVREIDLPLRFFANKKLKPDEKITLIGKGRFIKRLTISLRSIFLGHNPLKVYKSRWPDLTLSKNVRVIHFQNSQNSPRLLAEIPNNTNLIFTFRGFDINIRPDKDAAWNKNLMKIFENAKILHFVSDGLRQKALERGAPKEKCMVIKRSVDLVNFYNSKAKSEKSETIQLLSVGRIAWEKGHIYGLEALARLKKEGYKFNWKIIGRGPDLQIAEIQFHIKRLDLMNEIELCGFIPKSDLRAHYEKTDIYFHPSLSEGLPNSILEAASMSLPILASNAGGIPEAVKHEYNGLIHTIADVDQIYKQVKTLFDSPQLRSEYGKNSRNKMEIEFNPKNEIETWKNLYQKLSERDTGN